MTGGLRHLRTVLRHILTITYPLIIYQVSIGTTVWAWRFFFRAYQVSLTVFLEFGGIQITEEIKVSKNKITVV
jgi:hypothetical protein